MSKFDIAVIAIFGLSALIGLARGATRELTTMFALAASAFLAFLALRFTGPIAHRTVHAVWLADTVAVIGVFVVLYLGFRTVGGAVTRSVRSTVLSGPDRLAGAAVGAVRAWVVVGGLALLLDAVTPIDRMPLWITGARTYPLVTAAAGSLRALAPRGMKIAKAALPSIGYAGDTAR